MPSALVMSSSTREKPLLPCLVFLGAAARPTDAKTGFGIRDWAKDRCIGQFRLPGCQVDLGLPDMSPQFAAAAGAAAMVIGVAPAGGRVENDWIPTLKLALEAGLDLVSGMHQRLAEIPELQSLADLRGVRLHDVRHTDRRFDVATGMKRSGKRLLTVGLDCAIGKKYTALKLTAALRSQGVDATFRATGQTGIMIAGDGVAIDAVVADFISGAAESLSPGADPNHWDIVEGQGSLFHPSYAGVALGLLHGSQPDALVICHDHRRVHVDEMPHIKLPTLEEAIRRNEEAARLTNPMARCIGVALNTSGLDPAAAHALLADIERSVDLPVEDPMRTGMNGIVQAVRAI